MITVPSNNIELREYQKNITNDILLKMEKHNRLLCIASMGAGKSIIIMYLTIILLNKNKKIAIVTNISRIFNQLSDYLEKFNIPFNIIKSNSNVNKEENNNNVWLIMEQSFHHKEREKFTSEIDIVFKDEYHIGAEQKRYKDIEKFLNPNTVIGFTGTPYDEKGYLLEQFSLDNMILHGTARELTNMGYLVPLKYFVPKWSENVNYRNVKILNNDYSSKDLNKIINTHEHIYLSIKAMNAMNAKNKKTLIYANNIEHAENLYKYLKEDGYKIRIIHSQKGNNENLESLKLYKKNKEDISSVNCLISVNQLTTGFDEPQSELLVLSRATKILRLYLQIIFRVARLHPNKKYAEILDLGQCLSTHGFGDEYRNFIKKGDKKGLMKEKERVKKEVIKTLTKNNNIPTLIEPKTVSLKLKEYKIKKLNIEDMEYNTLLKTYQNTLDIDIIINIGFEINFRSNSIKYTKSDIEKYISKLDTNNMKNQDYILKIKKEIEYNVRNKIKLY